MIINMGTPLQHVVPYAKNHPAISCTQQNLELQVLMKTKIILTYFMLIHTLHNAEQLQCPLKFSLAAQTSLSHPPSYVLCLTPALPNIGDAASVGAINIQSSLLSGFGLQVSIMCLSGVVGVWHRHRFHREKDGRNCVGPHCQNIPCFVTWPQAGGCVTHLSRGQWGGISALFS